VKDKQTARIVRQYRGIAGITIGAVIFLILVGGLVRMTGSGMGCPDWPRCFGQWVPPTDLSQLPPDYKEQFAVAGKEIADFEAFKTWVEYINRLIGVLIGLFAIATVLTAFRLPRLYRRVKVLSLSALLLTIIQGGIGAYVVKTDLHTGMISLHMFIALLILGVLIAARLYAYPEKTLPPVPARLKWLAAGLLVVSLIQIFLGTQVREAVDVAAKELGEGMRGEWLNRLGWVYEIHQVFYYLVVGGMVWLGLQMRPYWSQLGMAKWLFLGMCGILMAEVGLGIGMHYLEIPAWMQPVHLLLATGLFACEWALLGSWLIWKSDQTPSSATPGTGRWSEKKEVTPTI
jgi:cytochrome c oxidase assembly protein subunit 15